jgi:DNA-directed RNA polymerase sigma subunit (sigma70/sigma32)
MGNDERPIKRGKNTVIKGEGGLSHRKIGAIVGLSAYRVKQIERKAIQKLLKKAEKMGISLEDIFL